MIDIYDEIGYIKNILANGLSTKWERDAILLTRYYKMEGYNKVDAKKYIYKKCEDAAVRPKNPIYYNHLVSYKKLNNIINTAWRKKESLRAIKEVVIAQEVLDWFLNLSNSVLLDEQDLKYYKRRRPSISIKKSQAFNWNRVKYLFTLYIWTKIQENYLDRPNIHYLDKYAKRFKEDAHLPDSFSLRKERDFLNDLGYIKVNYALGIEASFIDKFEVFKTPVTDKNAVHILTGEPPNGDLYNPGFWLDKQRMGSFVCQNCHKEFAYYDHKKNYTKRKYCKECSKLLENHIKKIRVFTCVDCGKEIEVPALNTRACRCSECQKKYRANKAKEARAKPN